MKYKVERVVQIGPTVGIHVRDEKGREAFAQVYDLPFDESGVLSCLDRAVAELDFPPPAVGAEAEPAETERFPIKEPEPVRFNPEAVRKAEVLAEEVARQVGKYLERPDYVSVEVVEDVVSVPSAGGK